MSRILLILFIVIPLLLLWRFSEAKVFDPKYRPDRSWEIVRVLRVVDGDTIKVAGEVEFTVRLVGLDTPETVHPRRPVECFGLEASAFAKEKLGGRLVKLVYQKQRLDKYGRVLAYVYYKGRGWKLFNVEAIKKGFGYAYRRYPHKYSDRFLDAEIYARRNGRGLWMECY